MYSMTLQVDDDGNVGGDASVDIPSWVLVREDDATMAMSLFATRRT